MRTPSLKEAIAAKVNAALADLAFEEGQEAPAGFSTEAIEYGVTSIEPHRVAPLEYVVRVRTKNTGVRYFAVRTSEPL